MDRHKVLARLKKHSQNIFLGSIGCLGLSFLPSVSPYVDLVTVHIGAIVLAIAILYLSYTLYMAHQLKIVTFPKRFSLFGILIFLLLVSSYFSISPQHSFFGFNLDTQSALFIGVLLCFSVAGSIGMSSSDRASLFFRYVIVSGAIVSVFHTVIIATALIFGKTFSVINDPISLSLYSGLLLLICAVDRQNTEVALKKKYSIRISILCFAIVFVFYAPIALLILGALLWGYSLLSLFVVRERDTADEGYHVRMSIIGFVGCVFLVFLLFLSLEGLSPRVHNEEKYATLSLYEEVRTTYRLFSDTPSRILIGSGPDTYRYVWNTYGLESQRESMTGSSFLSTLIPTIGVPGTLLMAFLLFASVFISISRLRTVPLRSLSLESTLLSVIALYGVTAIVFFNPGPIFLMLTAFFIGGAINLGRSSVIDMIFGKSYLSLPDMRPRKKMILVLVTGCLGVSILLGSASLLIANVSYQRGIDAWIYEGDFDKSQRLITKAINVHPQAVYYRVLSEIQQQRMAFLLEETDIEEGVRKAAYYVLAQGALQNAKDAVEKNDADYLNHLVLGDVYARLYETGTKDAELLALEAYNTALMHKPQDLTLLYRKASLYKGMKNVEDLKEVHDTMYSIDPMFVDDVGLFKDTGL